MKFINNRNLFLKVLEARKSRPIPRYFPSLLRATFLPQMMTAVSSHGRGQTSQSPRPTSYGQFMKALSSIHECECETFRPSGPSTRPVLTRCLSPVVALDVDTHVSTEIDSSISSAAPPFHLALLCLLSFAGRHCRLTPGHQSEEQGFNYRRRHSQS